MSRVQTQQGWLEGEVREVVTKDAKYHSFKGIPYAAPPVGKLRFKAPQPPIPWSGVRKATEHGAVCPQYNLFTLEVQPGNEDCLHLNVYTPDLTPAKPLPVMVYWHGGGYKSGSGNDDFYGPDFLVKNDVIVVTVNYRLEVLGFLCLDTEDVPGNAGLKDQVAALRWVQNNIQQFGGDPNNVTIFGESAGGSATSYHILSPMSKGLFQRAIAMSGVPFNEWCQPFEPRRRAFKLGQQLGLRTDDPKELLEFLQSLPVEKLFDTNPALTAFEEVLNAVHYIKMYYFNPVVEKDFGQEYLIKEDPFKAVKEGKVNDVDIMMGHTSKEAVILAGAAADTDLLDVYNKWPELLVPRKILINSSPTKTLELAEKIHKHYFGNKPISKETFKEFIDFASHADFNFFIQRFIRRLPKQGNKRYFYRFNFTGERDFFGAGIWGKKGLAQESTTSFSWLGSSHMDDVFYLFHANRLPMKVDKNAKAYEMIQTFTKLFTNFAKFGDPTPDSTLGVRWPEYDPTSQHYLDIAEKLTVGDHLEPDVMAFWKSVYDEAGEDF